MAPTTLENPLLGVHTSIAGGLEKSIERGMELNCTALQIFTHSNRQWRFTLPSMQDAEIFQRAWQNSPISSITIHATYLINLGSAQEETHKRSINMLIQEIRCADMLGIKQLVVHPGSAIGSTKDAALMRCAQSINDVIHATSDSCCKILLETMAGQGSVLCSSLSEIAHILSLIEDKSRIGVCVDTCHIFSAGYDIRTTENYEAFWKHFETIIGMHQLYALHINDSKNDLNSHIDRHTHIGEGTIGIMAFKNIMNDVALLHIPKILETPKELDLKDDKKNMSLLHSLVDKRQK